MKGYWGPILAVIGMFCLSLAGMVTMDSRHPIEQGNTTQSATDNPSNQIDKSNNVPVVEKDTIAASPEENLPGPADDKSYYNREDLKAQESMADWTRYTGIAAYMAIFLSTIGIGLIFVTFQQTRRAAQSATDTYKAYVAVERPRLLVAVSDVDFVGSDPQVTIDVTNIGKSSCVVKGIYWSWQSNADYGGGKGVAIGPPRHELVKPSETETLGFIGQSGFEQDFVRGVVVYESPFQKRHKSFFCFQIWQEEAVPYGLKHRDAKGKDWPADT